MFLFCFYFVFIFILVLFCFILFILFSNLAPYQPSFIFLICGPFNLSVSLSHSVVYNNNNLEASDKHSNQLSLGYLIYIILNVRNWALGKHRLFCPYFSNFPNFTAFILY